MYSWFLSTSWHVGTNRVSCLLQVLTLAVNSIGDEGAEAIAVAAAALPRLRRLSLMNNDIADAGARAVCCAVPDMGSLRQLILAANPISVRFQDDLVRTCESCRVQVLVRHGN